MLFYLQYLKKAVCIKPKYIITLDYIGQLVSFLSSFILLYIHIYNVKGEQVRKNDNGSKI